MAGRNESSGSGKWKMYKCRLQEVCQEKGWALPQYWCMKDGADHNPHFCASVSVNRLTFNSPLLCKSSKQAHNQAAMLAYLHFTHTSSDGYQVAGGPKIEETAKMADIHSDASDSHYQYKMMLNNYAQRKNLELPLYSTKKGDSPHAHGFKSTVTIDGRFFESLRFYQTLKEAEQAAAQVAWMSFSLDLSQENDSHYCKNLLQEMAQSEGFILPTYKTIKSGESHNATFFSTVEVEGDIFHGKAAKSKKQAELNAAKSAYTALMKRKSNRTSDLKSPASFENEALKFTPGSELLSTVDPKGKAKSGATPVSTPITQFDEQSKESEGKSIQTAEDLKFAPGSDLLTTADPKRIAKSGGALAATPTTIYEEPSKESEDSKMSKNMASYLLCNRVRVYSRIPDMEFPKGTVLLPIREDKWVFVSLEFPIKIDT